MLQLRNSRTGTKVTVGRSAPVIRISVTGPLQGRPAGPSELRVLITADLIRRVLEDLHGVQVFVVVVRAHPAGTVPGSAEAEYALRRGLEEFWIRPPARVTASVDDASTVLAGPVDLVVGGQHEHGKHTEQPAGAVLISVGAADSSPGLALPWTQQPSVAIPGEVVARVRVAVADNLDVPAALNVLHAVEDDMTISPGAKFETFLYLDRILGLDLGRDLGRQVTSSRPAR